MSIAARYAAIRADYQRLANVRWTRRHRIGERLLALGPASVPYLLADLADFYPAGRVLEELAGQAGLLPAMWSLSYGLTIKRWRAWGVRHAYLPTTHPQQLVDVARAHQTDA